MQRRAYKVGTEHEETLMARARSFGSIRKLPSGKFQARYWHLGKQIAAEHTYAPKTDARRWLSTVEADIVRGDWVDPDAGTANCRAGPVAPEHDREDLPTVPHDHVDGRALFRRR